MSVQELMSVVELSAAQALYRRLGPLQVVLDVPPVPARPATSCAGEWRAGPVRHGVPGRLRAAQGGLAAPERHRHRARARTSSRWSSGGCRTSTAGCCRRMPRSALAAAHVLPARAQLQRRHPRPARQVLPLPAAGGGVGAGAARQARLPDHQALRGGAGAAGPVGCAGAQQGQGGLQRALAAGGRADGHRERARAAPRQDRRAAAADAPGRHLRPAHRRRADRRVPALQVRSSGGCSSTPSCCSPSSRPTWRCATTSSSSTGARSSASSPTTSASSSSSGWWRWTPSSTSSSPPSARRWRPSRRTCRTSRCRSTSCAGCASTCAR